MRKNSCYACTGCGDCAIPEEKECPQCNQEYDFLYQKEGEIVGCSECVERVMED